MNDSTQERRSIGRDRSSIEAVVKGRESKELFWTENTLLINVSKVGASFNLKRECLAGRLLSLIVKLPKNLRKYDRDKKLYRIWGLVQHCRPVKEDGEDVFQIGVAFVGKLPPKSYVDNPLTSFRVSGMDEDGFWSVGETKTPFVTRAHHRVSCSIEVTLELLDAKNEDSDSEETSVTENIGAGGAAVFSKLEARVGDAVKFTCDKYDFESVCVVRNRQSGVGDGRTTLHLQFAEPTFPSKELYRSIENSDDVDDVEQAKNRENDFESAKTGADEFSTEGDQPSLGEVTESKD